MSEVVDGRQVERLAEAWPLLSKGAQIKLLRDAQVDAVFRRLLVLAWRQRDHGPKPARRPPRTPHDCAGDVRTGDPAT